ncbi:MAG: hypothetical protein KAJ51_04365, partial [Thermoplasmata archaeon]|nr:hypothetical protein [Thermoplasmata archaeon]
NLTFKIDVNAPSTWSALKGIEGKKGWFVSEVSVELNGNDTTSNLTSIMYQQNDGSWQTYENIIMLKDDGQHTIGYYSIDGAGNKELPNNLTVKIDKFAPLTSASIVGIEGQNDWFVSNLAVELAANDLTSGIDHISYCLNDDVWELYSNNFNITLDGVHLLEFHSMDLAGNSESTNDLTVMIDTISPSSWSTINGIKGINNWYISEVAIELNGADETSGIKCWMYRINDDPWHSYSEQIVLKDEGTHTLEYFAIDLAGNIETANVITIKIDNSLPLFNISTPIDNYQSNSSNITVEWSVNDEYSGIDYYLIGLDNGSWHETLENTFFTFNNLTNGNHTIKLKAVDYAGNTEIAILNIIVNVTVPPSLKEPESSPIEHSRNDSTPLFHVIIIIFIISIAIIIGILILIKNIKNKRQQIPKIEGGAQKHRIEPATTSSPSVVIKSEPKPSGPPLSGESVPKQQAPKIEPTNLEKLPITPQSTVDAPSIEVQNSSENLRTTPIVVAVRQTSTLPVDNETQM